MPSLPTGTVTLLFTDIEESTDLLQQLGDQEYAEILAEHQRLLRSAFTQGHAQEVDTQGDAFLVVFPRARDAVAAAVAAQQALLRHAWPAGTSLRVRMGLHTGEPLSGKTGYVGIDVHRAARICSAGHGGQILVSDAVSSLAARDLPPRVSLRDLGSYRLKDLQQPEHIFQVVHPDLPSGFPRLKALDALPNNLPRQLTSFIGREKEKIEVKQLLSTTCLLTLTGAAGAGKTRLALQVATDVLEHYPSGVWLAQLAPLSDPTLVPKTVASALGIPEQPGRSLTETVVDYLRPRAALLLLDNCEHLLEACAHLADALLQTCPNLRIVATSREALGIAGELTYRVPSLSLPDLKHLPPLETLTRYEAVRLFVERAAYSKPVFQITSANAGAVAQVTHRLDGIPLAIELAAARVKALTVDVIVERLDDQFRLLTHGSRTGLPRHKTLRATLDWSYNLLSAKERVLLCRLGVFAGGFTLEAAESICAREGLDEGDILDLLTQLVDKSLVIFDERDGQGRYRLLEIVRQYSRERLQEAGEQSDVQRWHRDWYLALAEQAEPEVRGPAQAVWLERLEREHDNLRGAMEWSLGNDPEGGLHLASSLHWFWFVRGYYAEGRGWLETLLESTSNAPRPLRAKALHAAGHLASQGQGDYGTGQLLCEESLAVSRELGNKRGIALALNTLGLIASDQGDHAKARALLEEKLCLERDLKDKGGVALSLMNLGVVARRRGDLAAARTLYQEALAIYRELKAQQHIAQLLHNLGWVARFQGDNASLRSYAEESLTIRRNLRDKKGIAESLDVHSAIAMAQGQTKRAARLLGAADALREAIGSPRSPVYLATHNPDVARIRSELGDQVFAEMWAEGRAMTLEQATEYALAGQ